MRKAEYEGNLDCRPEDRVEPEDNGGAQSIVGRETKEKDSAGGDLMEKLLDRENLNRAFKRVKSNGGVAGIDGMTVDEMLPWLTNHREELLEKLINGTYKPQPVRRVEIPKPDGGHGS